MENIMTNRLDRGFLKYQKEFEDAAIRVLRSGYYILGKEVEEFEESFASFAGAKYCVGTGNGLDAITLACRAIGIGRDDEVIVQGNTFIASVMGITIAGGTPVFAEPDEYFALDPDEIEKKITKKTKAVMVVHLYGQTAQMDRISEICKRHGLRLIEDCAQAHGAGFYTEGGGKGFKGVGTFGDIGCFSFYPSKNIGAFGDGGAIITDSVEYRDRIRQLRNYGSSVRYHNEEVGINSRLDEMQAALLKVRLHHEEECRIERQRTAAFYDSAISNPLIKLPKRRENATHVFHQYVIRCERRDELAEFLKTKGVGTIIHYPIPPHLSKAYEYLGIKKGSLPFTERLANEVLSIPMYTGITSEETERVADALNAFR
ncbi:MAG: DegT/DnrJ/EryC1/StrS family aminotransferase [Lachnospiraceae bacterium]|nr:DegT/DnrJ/EryC1/StrS family aminotransferase [Lachnospiraceae bacterium]